MGEARRRGSFEDRRKAATKRNRDLIIEKMGGRDERLLSMLRTGLDPFLSKLSQEEWQSRRSQIIEFLKKHPEPIPLEKAKSIRIREDEIGWYLFLCEQTLDNPLCIDSSQAQRVLPFFVAIGERWAHAKNVARLDQKIKEVLTHYKNDPDGLLFEILVALSYAAKGWHVEFLEEKPPAKSPDMIVRKGVIELFVECKRLNRRTAYSEKEQIEYLRLWDRVVPVLIQNRQCLWLNVVFHSEIFTIPSDYLAQLLQKTLPIGSDETILYDDADITIHARPIDRHAVNDHLDKFMVKEPSPMLCNLLGGDWAPENSEVSVIVSAKRGYMDGCDAPVLCTYIERIDWACGMTRKFDAEASIERKARDITSLLADAVKQVPQDKPSIIHIAAETLEGRDVELRRTEKVMSKVPYFLTDKPVLAVRFHRLQSNARINMLFEFDETVEEFQVAGSEQLIDDIPTQVIVPDHATFVNGRHWEVYG